jgi:Tfp pilus assembly protein PilF
MQEASDAAVLGDFRGVSFTHFGMTSTFYKQGGRFMVRTDGPDGHLQAYEIAYTFGAYPLQQYLIAFPDGRLQALSIAWDSRPPERGGQRWFHLYPNEAIPHHDLLHWTSPSQNWNTRCAACHSTHLQKHYEPQTDRYQTSWAEIDVSCEACHGPGSHHVAWAKHEPGGERAAAEAQKGLLVRLDERQGVTWSLDPTLSTARRTAPKTSQIEIELCARCHSRRSLLSEDALSRRPLLETHLPSLLEADLYYADGQIQDEVYVYGSFLQSKMYQAGVTCSDCHEPHSLTLRVPGNGVCAQCHRATTYDTPAHHFHPPASAGSQCVACHMPPRTYMVIDPRHDHSLRIPRPDLSVTLGVPNPCTTCHAPRSAAWAAAQVRQWYGHVPKGYQDYAEALHAGRLGMPAAERLLSQLAENATAPPIARATALAALGRYLSAASLPALQQGLHHHQPLLRVAAVEALEAVPQPYRLALAGHLLNDPIRAVRIHAARTLVSVPVAQLTEVQRQDLDRGVEEYITAQHVHIDSPEAQLNLGGLYRDRGQLAAAEAAYHLALQRQPAFVPAYVNLADLYHQQGQDDKGERLLRQALTVVPEQAEVHHALGLLLVRQQRHPEAVAALAQAASLRPDVPRYSYVYAIALHDTGTPQKAIDVLEAAHKRHPYNREMLTALVAFHREQGNFEAAQQYAATLQALAP